MKRYVFFPYPGRSDEDEFVVTVEDEATMLITDVSTEAGRGLIDMVTKARGLKQTVPIVAKQLQVNWMVQEADGDGDVEKGDGQPP